LLPVAERVRWRLFGFWLIRLRFATGIFRDSYA
jgi:hypothetical protein